MYRLLKSLVCMLLIISMLLCFTACGKPNTCNPNEESALKDLEKGNMPVMNTYTDVLKAWEDYMNCREWSPEMERKLFGSLAYEETKTLYSILEKSIVADSVRNEWNNRVVSRNCSLYGTDYKLVYTITNMEVKTPKRIEKLGDYFRRLSTEIKEMLAELDADTVAEAFEISKIDAENAMKALGSVAEILENAEVLEGYELKVMRTYSGSKLEREQPYTCSVYRINGTWVFGETEQILFWYGVRLRGLISSVVES